MSVTPNVNNAKCKIRPPVKWHGGDSYTGPWIIDQFPLHRIYVEPFGGAASVLLNKPFVEVEVYNDLDERITRLFRVLRDHGEELQRRLQLTPYSELEFDAAAAYPDGASDIEKARLDYVRWRQSHGGQGQSLSATTSRARGGKAGDVNAWWTSIDQLPQIIERLRRVQIMCRPAVEIIKKIDNPEAVIYCDPPYPHSTQSSGSRNIYAHEMSDDDHRELAVVLRSCRAAVVLAGYPCDLYDRELYPDWRRVVRPVANHAAGGKEKRKMEDVLWIREATP